MDLSNITRLISSMRAQTAKDSITPNGLGSILQRIVDAISSMSGIDVEDENAILQRLSTAESNAETALQTAQNAQTNAAGNVIDSFTAEQDIDEVALSLKQHGYAAKQVVLPAASSTGAGIMTATDKSHLETAYSKRVTLMNTLSSAAEVTLQLTFGDGSTKVVTFVGASAGNGGKAGLMTKEQADQLAALVAAGTAESVRDDAGYIKQQYAAPVVLRNVSDEEVDDLSVGDIFYDAGNLWQCGASENTDMGAPSKKVIYYCLADQMLYRWTGSRFVQAVRISSGDIAVPTKLSDLINDMGFLTAHQSLKTINGQTITGTGNITIDGAAELKDASNHIKQSMAAPMVLRNVTNEEVDDLSEGDVFFDSGVLWYCGASGNVSLGNPSKSLIYYCRGDQKFYRWTGSSFTAASSQSLPSNIVQSVSVNGQSPVTPDQNGNVNIQVQSGGDAREISILFVGNSLTQDAVSYLPLVLSELCPTLSYKFYIWYDGGATLTNILSKWNNDNTAAIFSTCENAQAWSNAERTQTMSAFLASGKTFDIVCMEEYFNYKREDGYTSADKQVWNDAIAYIRSHYNKPFKVVSFFHRPLVKDTNDNPDLAIADEVFGLTYDGVRWQLENTISEDVIPTGIAAYRAMYNSVLNGLGDFGYMSPDGTHGQEGLPCLMQAWVTALWIVNRLGIPVSINNIQGRVTSANYSSIHVPGPNLGNGLVVGTSAQDKEAMNVAIQAYKEGVKMVERYVSPNGVPAYKIEIAGATGTHTERLVQLSASLLPPDAEESGITWSVVSGDASVNANGLVYYTGTSKTANVVIRAALNGKNIKADVTLAYSLNIVETPVITPAGGDYSSAQSVEITCATEGATIHYTTDGSTPTASSSVYSSAIAVTESMTIKAIAVLDDKVSSVASATYTITALLTVNVTDEDDNAVTDAAVTFGSITLSHVGNGEYVAQVPRGATDTLTVSKAQFTTNTQQVVISSSTVTVDVTLEIDPVLDVVDVQGARSIANLCPSVTNNKIMLQGGSYTRGGALIPVANASIPTPWSSDSSATDAQKGANSCPEWPAWAEILDVVVTAPVSGAKCGIFLGNTPSSGTSAQAYTGGGWLSSISKRFLRTNFPNVLYIAISFDKTVSLSNAQLKQYVSIMAFKDQATADAWYAEHGGTAPSVQS